MEITEIDAKKVLSVVDYGLVKGVGTPHPGYMCVESAVCYALGEKHSDKPSCVAEIVRNVKICYNDSNGWRNTMDRADGLRRLAVAQLGTASNFDGIDFARRLITFKDSVLGPSSQSRIVNDWANSNDPYQHRWLREKIGQHIIYDVNTRISQGKIEALQDEELRTRLVQMCEGTVQILKDMDTPGSKWLHLADVGVRVHNGRPGV